MSAYFRKFFLFCHRQEYSGSNGLSCSLILWLLCAAHINIQEELSEGIVHFRKVAHLPFPEIIYAVYIVGSDSKYEPITYVDFVS